MYRINDGTLLTNGFVRRGVVEIVAPYRFVVNPEEVLGRDLHHAATLRIHERRAHRQEGVIVRSAHEKRIRLPRSNYCSRAALPR
jgi:hypothetical protein